MPANLYNFIKFSGFGEQEGIVLAFICDEKKNRIFNFCLSQRKDPEYLLRNSIFKLDLGLLWVTKKTMCQLSSNGLKLTVSKIDYSW